MPSGDAPLIIARHKLRLLALQGSSLLVYVALMTDRYPQSAISDQDESQPEPRDIEKPEGSKEVSRTSAKVKRGSRTSGPGRPLRFNVVQG